MRNKLQDNTKALREMQPGDEFYVRLRGGYGDVVRAKFVKVVRAAVWYEVAEVDPMSRVRVRVGDICRTRPMMCHVWASAPGSRVGERVGARCWWFKNTRDLPT